MIRKMIAKIAAHKVVTTLVVATTVLGVGTGTVIVTNPGGIVSSNPQQPTATPTSSTGAACPVPGSHPKFIAIFVQGIGSYVLAQPNQKPETDLVHGKPATGSFNAATTSYCATRPGETPQSNGELPPNNSSIILWSMADGWLNYSYSNGGLGTLEPSDPSTVMANDPDIFNKLADLGGYVLPFSYTGATMSGTAADPTFTLNAYDGSDVAVSDPMYVEPPKLNAELISINKVFPKVPIIIIGHSNGGLIAEQWWLRYGVPQPASHNCGSTCGYHGVAHIWSLDSPINGVAQAGLLNGVTCSVIQSVCKGAVSAEVGGAYAGLWRAAVSNNPDPVDSADNIESEDKADGGMFTAEGTYGDPLYDAGDEKLGGGKHTVPYAPDTQPGKGILSQVMFSDSCMQQAQRANLSECKPESNVLISPCDGRYLNTQPSSPQSPADNTNGLSTSPPIFGLTGGDIYIHSEAKDCPGTVSVIVNYARTLPPKATAHPMVMNPPADAIAAWNATFDGCASTMAASLRHVASLLPSSDTMQIADLNQFASLPLSELGEGSQQQQAEGQADLSALNKFFGTKRALTTFTGPCSA